MNLVYESADSMASTSNNMDDSNIDMECLTPAPYEFTDNVGDDDLTHSETLPHRHRRQHSHHGPNRDTLPKEKHPHSRQGDQRQEIEFECYIDEIWFLTDLNDRKNKSLNPNGAGGLIQPTLF